MLTIGTDLQRVAKFIVALLKTLLGLAQKREFDKVTELISDANDVAHSLELAVAHLMPPGGTSPPPKLSFANILSLFKWLGQNYSLVLFVVWSAGDLTKDFRDRADALASKWGFTYK